MKRTFIALSILSLICAATRADVFDFSSSKSHVPLPWDRNAQDLALQLQGRLRQQGPPQNLPEGFTPEQVNGLSELFKKNQMDWPKLLEENPGLKKAMSGTDFNDPDARRRLAEQIGKKRGEERAAPESAKKYEDFLKKLGEFVEKQSAGLNNKLPEITPSNFPKLPDRNVPPTNDAPQRQSSGPVGTSMSGGGRSSGGIRSFPDFDTRTRSESQSRFGKSLERWFPKSVQQSSASKNFLRSLEEKDWGKLENSRWWKDGRGPNVNWDRVGRGMSKTGRFLDRNLPSVSGRSLPNAPNINAPTLPSGPNLPSMAGPSMPGGLPDAGGAFTALMVILGVAVGALLFWRLLLRPMRQATEKPADLKLGEWPIDPSKVRTRDELVRAFDYLALLLLGLKAKMWHFRTVAKRIGEDEAKRPAAENLADAYMQARYAPPAELLPEGQMQQARTDLCALAGVPAP